MSSVRQLVALIITGYAAGGVVFPAVADEETYKVGIEGFSDNYKEPDPGVEVNSQATYGSVTGSYTYSWTNYLARVEARASYGKDNYKSVSGKSNGIPQYETEERLLGGMKFDAGNGYVLIPYLGLGSRFYLDNGKGTFTSLVAEGYDRRIWQFYVPIGVSLPFTDEGWNYTPTLEYDQLVYGHVNSRLNNVPGYYNINNVQMMNGFGVRGDFMVGQKYKDFGWEAGPFFRYWNISESKMAFDPTGAGWSEPANTRLQAGAAVKVSF